MEEGIMEIEQAWQVNYMRVTVKMSDGTLYAGKLNIRDFDRASDFFRHAEEQFYLMVVSVPDGSEKIMMLNKNFIISAETE
jgi:hypothetical protein